MAQILVVDDDRDFLDAVVELLEADSHQVDPVATLAEARQALREHRHDLVILDLILPDGSGIELFEEIDWRRAPRVCVVTGSQGIGDGLSSFMGPRVSFTMKPLELDTIERLLAQVAADKDGGSCGRLLHFGFMVGESPSMQRVYEQIERVAPTRASVFINGESGTGKELVARAIHVTSGVEGPFIALNCGAVTRDLIGSELFGHEKGAFTGASARRAGCFERAAGGTLFLDEVTEMPIDLQPNLLRVLETGEYAPLGGQQVAQATCRVIAACNADLGAALNARELREDLYFRLAQFPIEVPPLRERHGDVIPLAEAFLDEFVVSGEALSLHPDDEESLEKQRWPGNVRELRHLIQRAALLRDPGSSRPAIGEALEGVALALTGDGDDGGIVPGRSIADVERDLIETTLRHFDGNRRKAADSLGISLKTLYNRLREYRGDDEQAAG